ncbi:relaxase/mobilization nuclease domain-containing protein [Actinocorallia populi]|uniref:relaxase/mobilization nuclease domain-containing protein n=1 Tax=Actinocorallia populi TaxID=2079200 RepID=UPI000D08D778|nr:relaxase/mobilization nuclease domain-containing protein [Actinocorallia populi]
MIGKITRGSNVGNLIVYLYGPGRSSVHEDPHVVAGFRTPTELEPSISEGKRDLRPLISLLRQPITALQESGYEQPVWQCSLRAAPEDPYLSDEQWAEIAEETLHKIGLIRAEDEAGCRWIAIRHADEHIHLVVTLAREDGRIPRLWNDKLKVRSACLAAEERYGLRRTAPADRTATPRPTRAELEKAVRQGREETPRQTLRKAVATAAAGAGGMEEFFGKLDEAGLLGAKRYSKLDASEVTGYKVGLPGDLTGDGQQVWFSGGKLAPELSLPKLLRRWADPALSADLFSRPRAGRNAAEREMLYRASAQAVTRASQQFRWSSSPRVRADIAAAATGVLYTAAQATGSARLVDVADIYARAGREPCGRVAPLGGYSRGLRAASRLLAHAMGPESRKTYEMTVALIELISCLADLAEAVAEHRARQGRSAQAEAAHLASEELKDMTRPRAHTLARSGPLLPEALAAVSFPAPPTSGVVWNSTPPAPPGPSTGRGRGRGR